MIISHFENVYIYSVFTIFMMNAIKLLIGMMNSSLDKKISSLYKIDIQKV